MPVSNILVLAIALLAGLVLVSKKLAGNRVWRATITPLASIIGSGFLVLGPILQFSYGYFAPLVMALLCLVAYLFGAAIRANIRSTEAMNGAQSPLEARLDRVASWSLAFAYVVSVAYYLNLFGAFGVSLTEVDDRLHARLLTSAVLVLILIVGWSRGFSALEKMEQVFVGLKLAIILGLIAGLILFNVEHAVHAELVLNPPQVTGWSGLALAFGLIVTIQGFETSRYLGDSYDAPTRIRSMKLAQWVSAAIYIVYIALISFSFEASELSFSETAIIDMMQIVAPILPVLLVVAALSAQFSAAVADTGGSGGLFVELSKGKINVRYAYALLVGAGLLLTWTANLFEIIAYASRAFALYYALQSAIAAINAFHSGRLFRLALFASLCVLGLMIVIFGTPVEV